MMHFIAGMLVTTSLVAALVFLRFWRKTKDRFFALFALSFLVTAANRASLAFIPEDAEPGTFVYLVRLVAFVVILVAIWDKNRARGR